MCTVRSNTLKVNTEEVEVATLEVETPETAPAATDSELLEDSEALLAPVEVEEVAVAPVVAR